MQKGAVSAVIATVLIVLITISLVSVLWFFVVPIVKDSLASKEANEVGLSIETGEGYTVWDESTGMLSVQVKRDIGDEDLTGIKFYFTNNDGTNTQIINDVPLPGQTKVYNFNLFGFGIPYSISFAPITSEGEGAISPSVSLENLIGSVAYAAAISCVPGLTDGKIVICTCTDLQNMKNNLTADYLLEQNIDCSGIDFKKIGSLAKPFKGTLDGKGYIISNLNIQDSNAYSATGLFAKVENAKISKIGIIDANVSGNRAVGIIAGYFESKSILENVYTTGNVEGSYWVGGIVGHSKLESGNSSIINSYSTANVTAKEITAGGIIGVGGEKSPLLIKNSFATGVINVKRSDRVGLGALVGTNAGEFSVDPKYGDQADIINSAYYNRGIPCTWKGGSGDCISSTDINWFYNSLNQPMASWDFENVWQEVPGSYPTLRGEVSQEIVNGLCGVERYTCDAGIPETIPGNLEEWVCLGENGGFEEACFYTIIKTIKINASEDSYVNSAYPTNKYRGSETILSANGNPEKIAYYKFDLTNLGELLEGQLINSVKLRFYVVDGVSEWTDLSLTETSWTEDKMVYSTRPTLIENIAHVNGALEGNFIEFDVTQQVNSNIGNPISFAFSKEGSNSLQLSSKEDSNSAHHPVLEIETTSNPNNNEEFLPGYRPFKENSFWNLPLPTNTPVDINNQIYIDEAMSPLLEKHYLSLTGTGEDKWRIANAIDWAMPIYWSDSEDPLYTITPLIGGPTVKAHIPSGATTSQGSDLFMIVFDKENKQVFSMWQAIYYSNNDTWVPNSTKLYDLASDGLSWRVEKSTSPINEGHRGQPPSILAIRTDEIESGVIKHRLQCTFHATGRPNENTPWYYWPFSGYEPDKGGIVPEGIIFRIKPEIDLTARNLSPAALIIAKAMQDYGCVVGDNGGAQSNKLNLEFDLDGWNEIDPLLKMDSLSSIPYTDYEFIDGNYNYELWLNNQQ